MTQSNKTTTQTRIEEDGFRGGVRLSYPVQTARLGATRYRKDHLRVGVRRLDGIASARSTHQEGISFSTAGRGRLVGRGSDSPGGAVA